MKKKLLLGANIETVINAKALRYHLTPAEHLLYGALKMYIDAKFRSQHPLGNYIADFYCHKHKTVIEVDGSIDLLPEVLQNDKEKQAFLKVKD